MPLTKNLLERIKHDFNAYTYVHGTTFRWSPEKRQITYTKLTDESDLWTLLHELAHAELGHHDYELDIYLLQHEVAAWVHARDLLGPRYGLNITEDYIDDHLESYRHWLHERSTCPNCGQNGIQTTTNTYSCLNCRCLWRVNDARMCRLRRIKLQS